MATRDDIVRQARRWLGVKWQHQGRTRHGIDCVGLADVVALELGLIEQLHRADYPRQPDGSFIERLRATALVEIAPQAAQAGDLVAFTEQGTQCHCGILAELYGWPSIIHAYVAGRIVREEPLAAAREQFGIVTHAFAFPGIEGAE